MRIALAGATGNLGLPILEALLNAGHNVTVLSRIGGNSSKLEPYSNRITIHEVDFTSILSLSPALQGVDVVVSCVTTLAIGSQNPLIDASVDAGVKRFIPAEFGMDSRNPLCIELPVCAPKVATQKYLLEKSAANPSFSFTAIANGLFLDWCLKMGIILDPAHHTATLYDGGDLVFSATTLAGIAKGVLGVIEHQAETANRVVYIHSAAVTQNQLIQYAKDKDSQAWQTTVKRLEEVKQESHAALAKGEHEAAMLGFSILGCWSPGYGGDYSGHLDNELLGVEELGESELRALVEGLL